MSSPRGSYKLMLLKYVLIFMFFVCSSAVVHCGSYCHVVVLESMALYCESSWIRILQTSACVARELLLFYPTDLATHALYHGTHAFRSLICATINSVRFRLPNVTFFQCYYFPFRNPLFRVVRAFTPITNHTSHSAESPGTDIFINP